MSEFEYVMVLVSLILGLGISQILVGTATLLRKSHRIKFYLPHTLCIAIVFIVHVQEWWVNYEYSRLIMGWHFSTFFFLIIYPILLFIMARLLFPLKLRRSDCDLKEFYLVNYRKLFLFGFLLALVAIPQNVILLHIPLSEQWNQIIVTMVLLFPVIWKTRNNLIHHALVFIMLGIGVVYIFYINPPL